MDDVQMNMLFMFEEVPEQIGLNKKRI